MKPTDKKRLLALICIFIGLDFFLAGCKLEDKPKFLSAIPLISFVGSTIVESDNSTDLFEGTTTDTYTIVLNSEPTNSISISITFDTTQIKLNNSNVSPVQISFTPENWNQAQTISVIALYDNITEGNHKSVITHILNTQGLLTTPVNIGTVVANIVDNKGSRLTSSFQSGTVTLGATNPLNVSLTTTVVPGNSYVYCNAKITSSNVDRVATCQLASTGASVTIQAGVANSSTVVNWYVVEFASGAFIQRGNTSLASSDLNATITLSTAIDLSRTFIIAYSRTTSTGTNIDEQRTVKARFLSTTSIEVSRNESGIPVTIEWQAIQLDGGRVQSGVANILAGANSSSVSISAVNLSNSFILLNLSAGASINGAETDYYVQASYSSTTGLTFSRKGTNSSVDVSWFAIEMVDGTTVQSGSVNVSSTSTSANASLSSVDSSKTMIVSSYQIETGDSAVTTQDSGTFSSSFLDSTTIQFSRGNAETNASIISWFAVQFQ
jgi:hypothetical protein